MKNYWHNAITFDEYLKIAEERFHNNPNKNDEYQEYYELGLQRTNRTVKTYKVENEHIQQLEPKNFNGKILIISEPWCGDASATVPAVSKFFEAAGIEVRIFLRDTDLSLIDQFLTNGTQSIPKIIIVNDDFSVKADWGPRPQFGNDLLKKFKENPETYPREDFYNDLQIYYAKNRGKDAIEEIISLL
ncbi:thioredoxin family protein [Chryseobacterium gotjawalense]|uniref:Thioredoxin family protein n=1 Tax=Chryseobacterium gotjawalense TaxID=3042315 RepID=A0ABY8RBN4_9FLAO|nr:thioredoxin family protein [Chryseobacterium sp. wdc7]WHF51375.1 thioredoxin family protein [Chryseobacterium sp. wdc7]